MKKASLGEIQSISWIKIVSAENGSYCVQVEGNYRNYSTARQVVYTWQSMSEAVICARGIAKMFNLPHSSITVEEFILI
jgi:hypothetical protein